MGFLSSILGVAAPIVGGIFGGPIGSAIGGALGGAISGGSGGSGGSSPSGTQTVTQQQQLDPRIAAMLFGSQGTPGTPAGEGVDAVAGTPGTPGLLAQYQALGQQPQSAGSAAFGGVAQGWLQNDGNNMLHNLYNGASTLMGSNIAAPQSSAAQAQAAQGQASQGVGATGQAMLGQAAAGNATLGQAAQGQAAQSTAQASSPNLGSYVIPGIDVLWNHGANVDAPSQNGMNLSGSYDRFINGNAGENPYLTGAIQKGINQASNAFQSQQADSTRNLQENILPGIRSNSVLAGQYGGSRQGIAEGRALGDFGREQQRALSQFGQNATDAAVSAQAGSFNQGQDRALAATQGLGAQQYGVASQNASNNQQANLANQAENQRAQQFNANLALQNNQNNVSNMLQNNQFNAGLSQQTNMSNLGNQQQMNLANLGTQQQSNLANQGFLNQFGLSNLGNQQQINLANMGAQNQFGSQNLGNQQQANMQNLSNQQQTGSQNLGNQQQTNLANAGAQQQSSLANMQAQLGTNSLNSANQATGLQGMSGLLNQIYGYGQNQDNFAMNRAQQLNGLLAPYLSANSSSSTQTPLYSNTAGNILGGAAGALGLYNQFAGLGGGGSAQDIRNGGTSFADMYKNLTGSFAPPGAMQTFNVSPGTAPVADFSNLFNFGG